MALQYVARKRLKVAGRTVEPGEAVPEASTWRNVQAYVNDGSLAVALDTPAGAVENAALKTQVADLSERIVALERLVAGAGEQDGDVEVIDASDASVLPDGKDGDCGAVSDAAQGAAVGPIDPDALRRISREELDTRAIALGIEDAPKLGSKGAVAAAINETLELREAS